RLPLNLVDDDQAGQGRQSQFGIGKASPSNRGFEIEIMLAGACRDLACQRGLAALARPENRADGIVSQCRTNGFQMKRPANHELSILVFLTPDYRNTRISVNLSRWRIHAAPSLGKSFEPTIVTFRPTCTVTGVSPIISVILLLMFQPSEPVENSRAAAIILLP